MPSAPLKACATPGCPALVKSGERFCPKHKNETEKEYQIRRGTPAQRGYGARWQKVRHIILARDPLCQHPGCTHPSTDVDHIISKARGGTDSLDNLQGLCHEHHSFKTVKEDGGFGNKQGVGG